MKSKALIALSAVVFGLAQVAAMAGGPPPPQADPSGFNKCRFISFSVPGGSQTALRVRLVSLHHVVPPYAGGPSIPFSAHEGQIRWVGPPTQYVEQFSNPIPFYASFLQCTPHYQDWSTVGLLHVTGSAIVPSSIYEVENLSATCMGNESSCAQVSPPLEINTTRWGDVQTPFNPPSPTNQPDNTDQSAILAKLQGQAGAIIKARALIAASNPSGLIDITPDVGFIHLSACVDAFQGEPYPYQINDGCPSGACCDADVNNDSNLTFGDVSIVVDCFRGTTSNPNCDVNCDGRVTSRDLEDVIYVFQTLDPSGCSLTHGACTRSDSPHCIEAIGNTRCVNNWSGAYLGDNTTCDPSPADCNGNGRQDGCDIDCSAMGGACDTPGCGGSADCNLNAIPDECDVAEGGDTDADDIIEACEGMVGACCTEAFCTMTTQSECLDDPVAVFQGVGVDCAVPAELLVYQADPNEPIPDGNGSPAEDTISVAESYLIADIDVDLVIDHTWIGDLEVTLTHNGETVVLVKRPGIPPPDLSGFGCPSNDYDIVLDDSGTGGSVESLCGADDASPTPVSPPNYTPNESLAAFHGNNAYGDWTIRARDLAAQDTGTLVHWSMHITSVPPSNICAPPPPLDDPTGITKSRCITISTESVGNRSAGPPVLQAIRIRMITLHDVLPPYTNGPSIRFTDFEDATCIEGADGCVRYVDEPVIYMESSGNATHFAASKLRCTPLYRDWASGYTSCSYTPLACTSDTDCPSTPLRCGGGTTFTTCTTDANCAAVGVPGPCAAQSCGPIPKVLHIQGDAIVPSSEYEVQYLDRKCLGIEPTCDRVSTEGAFRYTTRWCDIETPYQPPAPGQPDFGDISAMVAKFRGAHHPIKARVIVDGANPSLTNDVDFSHIAAAVQAYRGGPYPYSGPTLCP